MAVDENYLDNLLKSANDDGSDTPREAAPAMTAADRLRAMGIKNNREMRTIFAEPEPEPEPEPVVEEIPVAEPEPVVEEIPVAKSEPVVEEVQVVEEPIAASEPVMEEIPVAEPEPVMEEIPMAEPEPVVEEIPVAEPEPVVEEIPVAEPEPASIPEITPVSDDPNARLSADDIAAMFAQVEQPAPAVEEPVAEPVVEPMMEEIPVAEPAPIVEEIPVAEPEPVVEEIPVAEPEPAPIPMVTPVSDDPNARLSADDIAAMFAQVEQPAPAVEGPVAEPVVEPVMEEIPGAEPAPVMEEIPVAEPEPAPIPEITPVSDDPNARLSADDIAAMFAQVEQPAPATEESVAEPVVEPVMEEIPAAEPEPVVEEIPVAEPEPAPIPEITPVSDDPNAKLSADDIAAMFAQVEQPAPVVEEPVVEPVAELEPVMEEVPAAEPEPVMEDIPVAEPEPAPIPEITPVSDDPNAKLSADDIAAMFAQVDQPAPVVEESVVEPVAEPEPAPIPEITPVSDDPNAKLSADDIAAMFAQIEQPAPVVEEPVVEPVAEPEPVMEEIPIAEPEPVMEEIPVAEPEPAPIPEITPVSDDPNAKLSADDIAAMFAQVEQPAPFVEEPVVEPVAEPAPVMEEIPVAEPEPAPIPEITPVSDDPNARLSADDIAAMFAQVEQPAPAVEEPVAEPVVEPMMEEIPVAEPAPVTEEVPVAEPEPVLEEIPVAEPEPAPIPEITPVSDDPNARLSADDIAAMFAQVEQPAPVAEVPVAEPEPVVEEIPVAESEPAPIPEITPVSDDPNAKLSADDIAAMFAQVEQPAPVVEEPVVESVAEPEPESVPSFEDDEDELSAYEAEADDVFEEPAPVPEITPVSDDPNAKLSADDIAALFAQANPEPAAEEPTPEPELAAEEAATEEPAPVPEITPVSDDPNAKLSADDIAALFAQANPEPAAEEPAPEPELAAEEAATEEPAPVPEITPISDDPNAKLSADDIAALFAQANPEPAAETPAAEPEPAAEEVAADEPAPVPEITPISDDPNAKLSADDIAALFAQANPEPAGEAPAAEPEPAAEEAATEEPAPVPEITPVSDDPNAKLSEDDIAALFAQASPTGEPESEPADDPGASAEEPVTMTSDDIDAMFAEMGIDTPKVDNSDMGGDDNLSEADIEALLNGTMPEDGASLDEGFVPESDENLSEIEDLLSMSDNHEMVENNQPFDIFAEDVGNGELAVDELDIDQLLSGSIEDRSELTDEADDENPRKVKKAKKAKGSKKKKSKKADADEAEGEESEKKRFSLKELIRKFIEALTEEADEPEELDIPEKAAGEENVAILNEMAEEEAAGKKKKGKKGKKEKEVDPKAAAKAAAKEEAKKKKKEEAAKAKAEKAKKAKEAKEAKAKKKAEKEAALGPIKRLPKKKVAMIFLVFMPVLAALLVIGLMIPEDSVNREARRAYNEGDYDTTYTDFYGKVLEGDDLVMFNNSSCVLQMRRWARAYDSYIKLNMPREAVDSLVQGVACYDYLIVNYDTTYIRPELDASYNELLSLLGKYGISAEYARQILAAPTNNEYTRQIDDAVAGRLAPMANTSPEPEQMGNEDPGMNPEAGAYDPNTPDAPIQPGYDDVAAGNPPIYEATIDANGNVIPDGMNDFEDPGNPDGSVVYQLYVN